VVLEVPVEILDKSFNESFFFNLKKVEREKR